MTTKAINGKMKEARVKLGWSQEDLARELGVSLSTVQRWENMESKPSRLARREIDRFFEKVNSTGE